MPLPLSTRMRVALLLPAAGGLLAVALLVWLQVPDLPDRGALRRLTLPLLAAAGLAVVIWAGISWWLSRLLLKPLATLIATANRMAAGEFHHRPPLPREDELAGLARALHRLGDRVEQQVAAAQAERHHLETILASMADGVLVTDGEGRVRLANPAFRRLFGLVGEVDSRPFLELVRQPLLAEMVTSTLATGQGRSGELELHAPERRTLTARSAALRDERGTVVVIRDVTEFARLAAIRRDFVANVSHELKTPLAAIRGYAETLNDGALEDRETAHRFVGRILDQSRRLQRLLDDLLTLSRLETPEAIAERPVDLRQLIQQAVELVGRQAEERKVTLGVDLEPVPSLPGDPDALERMVLNLLENALKYNRPGGRVTIRLARTGETLHLEVTDTGIGIPEEALPRIFERFYRVDKGRSREEGGTGLGLAIVKHVAQSHGGRVEVTSRMGVGSTFRVILPVSRRNG